MYIDISISISIYNAVVSMKAETKTARKSRLMITMETAP